MEYVYLYIHIKLKHVMESMYVFGIYIFKQSLYFEKNVDICICM